MKDPPYTTSTVAHKSQGATWEETMARQSPPNEPVFEQHLLKNLMQLSKNPKFLDSLRNPKATALKPGCR